MEQEQEGENPQQTFCEYSIIRDIVLKVLKAQGIPNPSDEVIDSAIKEHLTPKVLGIFNKNSWTLKKGVLGSTDFKSCLHFGSIPPLTPHCPKLNMIEEK